MFPWVNLMQKPDYVLLSEDDVEKDTSANKSYSTINVILVGGGSIILPENLQGASSVTKQLNDKK